MLPKTDEGLEVVPRAVLSKNFYKAIWGLNDEFKHISRTCAELLVLSLEKDARDTEIKREFRQAFTTLVDEG